MSFLSAWHNSAVFKCTGVNEKRSSISQEVQEATNVTAKLQSFAGKTSAGKRLRIWKTRSCYGRTTVALENWTLGEELFATRKTSQLKLPNRIDLYIYVLYASLVKYWPYVSMYVLIWYKATVEIPIIAFNIFIVFFSFCSFFSIVTVFFLF